MFSIMCLGKCLVKNVQAATLRCSVHEPLRQVCALALEALSPSQKGGTGTALAIAVGASEQARELPRAAWRRIAEDEDRSLEHVVGGDDSATVRLDLEDLVDKVDPSLATVYNCTKLNSLASGGKKNKGLLGTFSSSSSSSSKPADASVVKKGPTREQKRAADELQKRHTSPATHCGELLGIYIYADSNKCVPQKRAKSRD